MRFSRDAVAYAGLLGSQSNLQCKDFGQNQASTISAVENLVQQGLASSVKLGDDHHFSGSTSRVPWDEILSDDLLPKVLRTTLQKYLEVVTADGFSILDLSHETARELEAASMADLGDTSDSIGGVYVKLCIKTAEEWRALCESILEDDGCCLKDKRQARMILKRIEDYAPDKTLCISYFGETHRQTVQARTAGGWPTRMCKKFGVDYTIKIADCRPYDIIMSECLESLLTGLAQEATNVNNPNDPPIHLMTSDGTGENAVHTGQRPWFTGNSISGKQLNIELRMLNKYRDKPISECGASAGLLDFVRRHRVDIIDFNDIKDEEHQITQLEVNRYWGHLNGKKNIKYAQDARSGAFEAVKNPDKIASTSQQTIVDNCTKASSKNGKKNITSALDAKSNAREAVNNPDIIASAKQKTIVDNCTRASSENGKTYGPINIKSARDARSGAFEAVKNPNIIASAKQQTIVNNCRRTARENASKLPGLTKSGLMNSVLRRYFVAGQVMKPSDRFLKQQQGCADVTRYLLNEAIESIPGLDSIKNTIKARSPLSKDDSKAASSIIDEHFPKLHIHDAEAKRAKLPPKKRWIQQALNEIEVETNKRRRVMIDV